MATLTRYILLVDDDAATREVVGEVLCAEGFAVTSVANGLDALEHVGAHGVPALVMMDLTMPVMDGKQLLAERRKWSCLLHVPFVVLTGNEKATAQELGVAEVLHKPVDLESLLDVARRYCTLSSGLYQVVDRSKIETG